MKYPAILAIIATLIVTPALAHDCCDCTGGMWGLSHQSKPEFKRELRIKILENSAKVACAHRNVLSNIKDGMTLDDFMYDVAKKNHRYWSDRCEELQNELIDEAF